MIRPVGFRVLVKPDPVKEQFKAGMIEIPDEILDKQRIEVTTGTVVGIGAESWKDIGSGNPWAAVGDHIVYSKYGGKIIEDPETKEKFVLINDKDVIGLI